MANKFLNGIEVSSSAVVDGGSLSTGSTILDIQGSQGQLFSVTNSLVGDLFSVSDISGIPILNVNSSGAVNVDGTLTVGGSITTVGGNIIAGGAIYPASNGSASLGLSNKQWAGLDLSSSSAITWGNGDAEIIEGETNNYSLTFKTYDGSANSAALRLDGDNTATFSGNVYVNQTSDLTTQALQVNGFIDITAVTGTALRWYNGSTFKGGLGLDDWAHSGSSSDITMYIAGDNSFHVSTNNVKRLEIDSSGATFAGNVALGGTGQYTTNQSLNIDGTGLAIKNNVNGSSNNWSYIHNTATASFSNLVFATGGALTALTLAHSGAATFSGSVTANGTVLTGDQTLPTDFVSAASGGSFGGGISATTGQFPILKWNAAKWGTQRLTKLVGGGGADTGDKWVSLATVDLTGGYEKVKIEFTIGSYDDNARGNEKIAVLYENHSSAQEGHSAFWYAGDMYPTLFKAIKSVRDSSSGLTNSYTLWVQIYGAWKDSFTVEAEHWQTGDSITYPTAAGQTTTPSGSDEQDVTTRQRWVDADKLDGQHGSYYAPAATTLAGYGITDSLVIGTTSTTAMAGNTALLAIGTTATTAMAGNTTIPADHGDHDGLYLPIGGGILTGDLKINTQIAFQRDGTNYSNYIKSSQYVSEGYNDSGTPPSDRYWLEYGAKGGHHFVLNTDGGTGVAENSYDDFTIWQGEVDGDRLFEVTNSGNTSITGGVKVFGSIESRKNIVSNSNYNIAQISSTRTTDDYGGLNKTYARLDVQTPGPDTDGASSQHGLGHLSIKLADNAGNSDLVQKALLRHDGELILGGFYPQTSETELAGLTIRSRYSGGTRNFLRFQTDHSSATTEWTMAKIYAGDGGNFNGTLTFQVATGSNASTDYSAGHDAQLETAMFINDTKEVTFSNNVKLSGANPYIQGTGTGSMRIKHTSGNTMYIRPDETGSISLFEGANSQPVYFMTQTPTVNSTTNESAQLKFHTRSKQSDGQNNSKYATIKHLTHSIGFNYTTLDFAGSDKSKFNMPIEAAGGLYFTGDTHMGFIPHPRGAQFRSDSSALVGYIKIELPTDIGITPDDMVSFHVDVYDYTTNETISVFIGGYTYTSTSTTAAYWYNPTAIITTKHTGKDFNVRYGYDGTHFYVAIGETTSVWSHPSIVVRDVQCSYRSNVEHYIDGWDVSVTTTTLTGVDETQTGNFPQAKHAITATTANAVAWGNITSRPYIELSGSVASATATTTINSVAHATYTAVFYDFVIKNGTNVRAGIVYACHDGTNVEFAETSTVDLGDTSDVTLSVDISGTDIRLRATTTSSTWTIKSLIRAI
tara:strand:+ start:9752 stop:13684 length:3933 start_codon:yes stop_codon:yes gene_type:complete